MNNIEFKCNVTEFDCTPHPENETNSFEINERGLVIKLSTIENVVIHETEIDKADAYRLARLILLVYEKM
jgi:hypothetical protein